jgi:hypothetical protein
MPAIISRQTLFRFLIDVFDAFDDYLENLTSADLIRGGVPMPVYDVWIS